MTERDGKDAPPDRGEVIRGPARGHTVFKNPQCMYCGMDLTTVENDDEHLIGRKFVPRGSLDNAWNLVARACRPCNATKADLEDDLSALTMMPNVVGRYAVDDERLVRSYERKAGKSQSRVTKELLRDSHSKTNVTSKGPAGVKFSFGFTGMPEVSTQRVRDLARYHVMGLFGMFVRGADPDGFYVPAEIDTFHLVRYVPRQDWGVLTLREFTKVMESWDPRLHLIAADGFFKATIARKPENAPVWGWALEWNQNWRVFGFTGHHDDVRDAAVELPHPGGKPVAGGLLMREETPLDETDDSLFQDRFPGEA